MNTNDYVERAMELCGVTDSRNRNVFAKYFGKLGEEQCEEVLETFTQKLSEGSLDHSPAYLTGMLKRKIDDVQECAPRNSDLEDPGRDGVCDGSEGRESEDSEFDSGGIRVFKNLSRNADCFGVLATLYEGSYWEKTPSCRLAALLGGIEALIFGRLISYRFLKDAPNDEDDHTDEELAANRSFWSFVTYGISEYPYDEDPEFWNYYLAKVLDDDITKNPANYDPKGLLCCG